MTCQGGVQTDCNQQLNCEANDELVDIIVIILLLTVIRAIATVFGPESSECLSADI